VSQIFERQFDKRAASAILRKFTSLGFSKFDARIMTKKQWMHVLYGAEYKLDSAIKNEMHITSNVVTRILYAVNKMYSAQLSQGLTFRKGLPEEEICKILLPMLPIKAEKQLSLEGMIKAIQGDINGKRYIRVSGYYLCLEALILIAEKSPTLKSSDFANVMLSIREEVIRLVSGRCLQKIDQSNAA